MEKGTKYRLLYLYQMLMEQSDEAHPITTNQLISLLKEKYDITVNRNTLSNDLQIMQESGLHVEVVRSTQNKYYYDGRYFEVPELKVLIDVVSSAKFITERESERLIEKLLQLTSQQGAEQLRKHLSVTGRVKSLNEKGYYIVDAVNDAIDKKRKISFRYTDYDAQKNLILKNSGKLYVLSPYEMIWDGDFYYVMGYCDSRKALRVFRLDRIESQPEILQEPQVPPPSDFYVKDYVKSVFRMFRTDELIRVDLLCTNHLMKYMIDKFGLDVSTRVVDDEHFVACVNVCPSLTFYRWVFGWNGEMKILGPRKIVGEYQSMLKRALDQE